MSYVSSINMLSNVSSASRITALAAYSLQNIGVCLFLGNVSGNLYVYDLSYSVQKEFNVSLSGTVFQTGTITGLATSDQYLFVNSPGKCFQVPLNQMFLNGSWGVTIGPPNLFPVANCWSDGISNTGGIAVTPAADTLFMLYTPSTLSKISPPDSLANLVIDAANVPFYVNDGSGNTLTNITIDSRNTTVYFGDTSSKSVYEYNYSSGSNGVILSNVYFQDSHLVVSTCGMAFSPSSSTLAYGRTDFSGQSSIDAWNPRIERYTTIAEVGYFNNVASLAYDSNDTLYIAAQENLSVSSSPYYLWTNTFVYTPRPAPSVQPLRQRPVKCGLIEPGSCKRAYQPFSPRERFGWGSPNRPYLTPDNNVGCPPVYVTTCTPSSGGGGGGPSPPDPDATPPVNPVPSIATSTTQYLARTRVATSNYVVTLNSNSFAPNPVTTIQSSPTFDYNGRVYYIANGVNVYYTDNYATVNTLITLGDSTTSSLTAGPACSAVDATLALGNSDGYVLMVDPTKSFPNILAWEQQFSGASAVTSLAYIEKYVYASTSNALACFLASDGTLQWMASPSLVGGDTYSSQINVQQGNVFIGTTRGTLWNYSPITGQSIFSIPVNTGPILGTANIDTSSRVFFGSGSNLFACPIDRTQSADDLVYTNIFGNITAGVTLAVDSAKSTRAFFTTDAKRMYCVQIDSNVGTSTDLYFSILRDSLPVLDISYAYVVGGVSPTQGLVRFPWYSVNLASGNLAPDIAYSNGTTTSFAPRVLINSSNSIVLLANTGLFTLS